MLMVEIPHDLVDVYGAPLSTGDLALSDLHGNPVQAPTDEGANYTPAMAELSYDQACRLQHQAEARAHRREVWPQALVDQVRHRVTLMMARDCLRERRKPATVYHLWWPHADQPGTYELRTGNPPADCDRPLHLRRLALDIDLVGDIPSDVRDMMEPGGIADTLVQTAIDDDPNPKVSSAALLMETVKRLATTVAWKGGARR